jgi:predicted nucleic acid-binding Zn ribbon protein
MTHRRRTPRSLSLPLDTLQDMLAPRTLLADVQRVWPRAVGPAIAAEAIPRAERGGVLTVSCSAAVWAQELDLMGPSIVDRLAELIGPGKVQRLRCVAL